MIGRMRDARSCRLPWPLMGTPDSGTPGSDTAMTAGSLMALLLNG